MKDLHKVIKTIRLSEKATLLGERTTSTSSPSMSMPPRSTSSRPSKSFSARKSPASALATTPARPVRSAERRADYGRTNHWKKAIVRLKEGEKLDLA
jgi:large subunit ribosomal protein L23